MRSELLQTLNILNKLVNCLESILMIKYYSFTIVELVIKFCINFI